MSDEEPTVEWKTIRIRATSYYKLIELSGLYTALVGMKISMSMIADFAISNYYDEYYVKARSILIEPDEAEKFRKKVGGEIKRISEFFTKANRK